MADTLEDCRKRAKEIVEDARRRARTIARRTDRRVHNLHRRCDEASDAKTKAIESSFEPAAGTNRIDPTDNAILHDAVEQLAKVLTTAERDGPTK
jgi:vacuolar-type H+-ATPase subunit H